MLLKQSRTPNLPRNVISPHGYPALCSLHVFSVEAVLSVGSSGLGAPMHHVAFTVDLIPIHFFCRSSGISHSFLRFCPFLVVPVRPFNCQIQVDVGYHTDILHPHLPSRHGTYPMLHFYRATPDDCCIDLAPLCFLAPFPQPPTIIDGASRARGPGQPVARHRAAIVPAPEALRSPRSESSRPRPGSDSSPPWQLGWR